MPRVNLRKLQLHRLRKVPDHTTISRFRRRFREELAGPFTEVLWLCGRGWSRWAVVDGTKMAGNASLSPNRTYQHSTEDRIIVAAEAVQDRNDVQ